MPIPRVAGPAYWGSRAIIEGMRKWELWENREKGSSSFFPESNTQARVMAMEGGETTGDYAGQVLKGPLAAGS